MSDLSSKLEPGAQSNIEISKAISLKRIADAMEKADPHAEAQAAVDRATAEVLGIPMELGETLVDAVNRRSREQYPHREVVNGVETMESVRKRTEARIAAEVAADDEWHVKEKPGLLDQIEAQFMPIDGRGDPRRSGYAYEFAADWGHVVRWRLIEVAP
jgi:hypothetical protein